MRLIFLYVQDGARPNTSYNHYKQSTNFYANRLLEEGYFYLLKRMVETNIVNEVGVFIESNRNPGYIRYEGNDDKIYGWVMPDINEFIQYIHPSDIIWCRGGFRQWYDPFLVTMQKLNHWMLLYAANTGRERWPVFDVVFNDLTGNNQVDARNTLQFDFKKPINPKLFYPINDEPIKYDLCIGASHIHDKKGQWMTVEALIEYKKIFGEELKCIMPGSRKNGTFTNRMFDMLKSHRINVITPGTIDRKELNKVYNQSKYFIHLGGGGQGDRGVLEAMACGCPTITGNETRHSKITYNNKKISTVISANDNVEAIARILFYKIRTYQPKIRNAVYDYYHKHADIEEVILPEMNTLFSVFRENSKRDMTELRKVYP